MRNTLLPVLGITLVAAVLSACLPHHALAQSSLGIGTSEATLPSTGLFAHFLYWINTQQQAFYRLLTGALKAMRTDGHNVWILVGLSFVYGIFHAAGPGHGKAVISSYMLANEVALRRGIVLSFVSAMLQALTAILLMALVFLVLRGTAISMTDASWALEIASYALIAAFGAWLLWRKATPLLQASPNGASSPDPSPAYPDHHGHHHHHAAGEICASCGHVHAPDPALLTASRLDWRTAWSAVAAVGMRPCSGALIVLTFAFLNGLWMGGILSVFAMALGTAITVSALAILAVSAKNWAVSFAGEGRLSRYIHTAFEIGGAALVLVLGLMLLAASLSA